MYKLRLAKLVSSKRSEIYDSYCTESHAKFTIFVSLSAKAAHKTLVKLTPGVHFINILPACFLYKIQAPKISELKCNKRKLLDLLSYKKGPCKMLMKLTPGPIFEPFTNFCPTGSFKRIAIFCWLSDFSLSLFTHAFCSIVQCCEALLFFSSWNKQ